MNKEFIQKAKKRIAHFIYGDKFVSLQNLIEEEKEYIREDNPTKTAKTEFSGLAISGGGIRSASFALGLMQALNGVDIVKKEKGKNDKVIGKTPDYLSQFDYLSTVSGGGYIGSSLTWFRHLKGNVFPFGRKGLGARTKNKDSNNNILNYIRQHGNYLTPCKDLDFASLIAIAVRSMFLSLAVYLSLLILFMLPLQHFMLFDSFAICSFFLTHKLSFGFFSYLALGLALLMAICSLIFSFTTFFKRNPPRYDPLITFQKTLGRLSKLFIGLLLMASLPLVVKFLHQTWMQYTAAGSSTLLGAFLGFLQYLKQQDTERSAGQSAGMNYKVIGGSFLLIYGLVLTAYLAAESILITTGAVFWGLLSALLGIGFLIGFFANLNHAGLHRMYRDRLMETFLPDYENVTEGFWGPATEANKFLLENSCKKGENLYHLINTNVVLVDSKDAKFRGRGGDSFLLSPLYCGSYATDYIKTSKFMKKSGRGITLPTAMAISGAAANPNTGVAGKGVTRSKLVSALMTLLNLRLGYWATNPKKENFKLSFWPPNYIFPGIFPGLFSSLLFGTAFDKNSYFLELTDGGHFENLALYELVRREVKFIVVSDGGADPKYTFEDLANAVERVRVDFGVKIRFKDEEESNLEGVLPKSEKKSISTDKYKLAKRGFAIADICYDIDNPAKNGTLIYIKPTLIKELPEDIYSYKSAHDTFPDQTTADQFFDEAQFEAYRELGYQLTKDMLLNKNACSLFTKYLIS